MYQNFQSRLMKEITNTNNIHHFNFGLVIIIVRTFGVKILFKEHFDFKFGIMDQFAYIDKCHWGWTRKKNPRSCQQQNKNEFAIKIFSQSESLKHLRSIFNARIETWWGVFSTFTGESSTAPSWVQVSFMSKMQCAVRDSLSTSKPQVCSNYSL